MGTYIIEQLGGKQIPDAQEIEGGLCRIRVIMSTNLGVVCLCVGSLGVPGPDEKRGGSLELSLGLSRKKLISNGFLRASGFLFRYV